MIESRLKDIDSIKSKFSLIDKSRVVNNIKLLRTRLENDIVSKTDSDFSETNSNKIILWLSNLKIKESEISIYWLSLNEGVNTNFKLFVNNYDEFWYPSSDDVWITGKTESWLLQMNHEENFCFFKFR